jgi:F-type H+-transporting ATPase subunit b
VNVLATVAILAQQAETHFEAENKWFPEAAEILWGTLAFVIIFGLLWKVAVPPIKKAMRGRTERIGRELDTAATGRAEAEAEANGIRQNLADIDEERQRILARAAETAQRMREEGVVRNDAEVADLEARADADMEAVRGRATSELQAQVAVWAADATELTVLSSLDDATLQQLVDDFIAEAGASK